MATPDARTRKVSLMPSSHRVRSTSIPANIIPQVLLSNILFALAIHAGKECVLKYDVGIFWVTLRVLAFGGLAVLIKEAFTGELTRKKSIEVREIYLFVIVILILRKWTVLGMSSLLLLVQQCSLFTILYRMSSTR